MKRFFFWVLALVLMVLVVFGLMFLRTDVNDAGVCGVVALVVLVLMCKLRASSKCPNCKKHWVAKKTDDEDLGVSSNSYTKKCGNDYHTFEKHKHLLSFRCTSCGHEWQKTVERERQLD